jgi:homoserine O-succinyltransferase
MDWSEQNVFSTLHICWGAQAGLFHHYGIPKISLPAKQFGVYPHYVLDKHSQIVRGFDELFYAPHSRHTANRREDILAVPSLSLVAESPEAGVFLIVSEDRRKLFVTGHPEYDRFTLKAEYDRDIGKGMDIAVPRNYFPDDDNKREPRVTWRGHANLLYANWLNYYVYQATPYNLDAISSDTVAGDDYTI